MDSPALLLLLQVVKAGGDASTLIRRGFTYSQIAKLLALAVEKQLLAASERSLTITDKGIAYLHGTKSGTEKRYRTGWISADEFRRVDRRSKNSIFLPYACHTRFKTWQAR